ncbi:MAG: chloride channel protein [Lachnospiraceae bacterium]|nr:chloride channel protein [Lachnospiraceae bacterium]
MHRHKFFLTHGPGNLYQFCRWLLLSTISGLVIGFISVLFNFGMKYADTFRAQHKEMILLLPLAGVIIVLLYRLFKYENNTGTDTVIESIQHKSYVPLRMAPLIFVSTILTVLCGGSVGREGAAVQIGGSIGEQIGERFKFNEKDKRILLMSGVSAAFSALFGTPMAAAFLPLEMANVGIMYYPALVPCIWSALIARMLAQFMNAPAEQLIVSQDVELTLTFSLQIVLLACLCAIISMLFCGALHTAKQLYQKYFKNTYLRIIVGGLIIIALTFIFQTTDYLGPGMHIIEEFLAGHVIPAAFLLKILFTAVTIGAGFKGGEIVPSFFTGAAFGALFGSVLGLNIPLCAAIGMAAVFCGVTNCPITALLISFELFGFDHAYCYLIAVAVSYMLSGYYSLYHSQSIILPKTEDSELH